MILTEGIQTEFTEYRNCIKQQLSRFFTTQLCQRASHCKKKKIKILATFYKIIMNPAARQFYGQIRPTFCFLAIRLMPDVK